MKRLFCNALSAGEDAKNIEELSDKEIPDSWLLSTFKHREIFFALVTDSLRFILRSIFSSVHLFPSVGANVLSSLFPCLLFCLSSFLILSFLSLLPPSLLSLLASFPLSPTSSFLFLVSFPCVLLCLSFFPFPYLLLLFTCLLLRIFFLFLSPLCILPYSSFHPFPCLLIHPFSSLFLDLLLRLPILLSLPVSPPSRAFPSVLFGVYFKRVGLFFRLPPYERRTSMPSMFSGY